MEPLLSFFCLHLNFLGTTFIGFVHAVQLWTYWQSWTLLSSIVIGPRFEYLYTRTHTRTHLHMQVCKHFQTWPLYCPSYVCTLTFGELPPLVLYTLSNRGPTDNHGPYCPLLSSVHGLNTYTNPPIHTVQTFYANAHTCWVKYTAVHKSWTKAHTSNCIRAKRAHLAIWL